MCWTFGFAFPVLGSIVLKFQGKGEFNELIKRSYASDSKCMIFVVVIVPLTLKKSKAVFPDKLK